MLCAKYGWNYPIGSGEENENGESLQQQRRRRTTAKFESEKLSWAKNALLRYSIPNEPLNFFFTAVQ